MQQYLNIIKYPRALVPQSLAFKYSLAFIIGLLVGFKFISPNVLGSAYVILIALCLIKCFQKSVPGFFTILPFVMYTEIVVRRKVDWLPYLSLQYLFIFAFAFLIFSGAKGKKSHFLGYTLLLIYTIVEVVDNVYPNRVEVSRATITHSFALLLPVIWASYTVLSSSIILKLLTYIKVAGIYLTAIVLVAHLTGGIDYGHQSSSEASNGLAPVQLSGYLGFVCILFFFSIMNPEEVKHQWLNIALLVLVASIMVLTFSRGGVYFVGAVTAVYFFYNRARMVSYFKLLLLIPIAAIVYYSVVETTEGKIIERYSLEGSSGRDELVQAAFTLFKDNIIKGVGTGNFNSEIVKKNLYPVESGAHNEFARAAAEHGMIGVFLYWGFFIFLLIDIVKRRQPQQQYAMYFLILFCLILIHNGLKISIQPILLMLAVATSSAFYKPQFNVYSKRYNHRRIASAS